MGITLYLGFNEYDNDVGNYCGKSFFQEIVGGRNPEYFNLDNFLTEDEQKLLYPDYADYSSYKEMKMNCRDIDPQELLNIFKKIYDYLFYNHDRLPLIHFISKDKITQMGTSDEFIFKGKPSYLDGIHHDPFHRNDLSLVSGHKDQEIRKWIPVSNELNLDGNIFYVESVNKFDEYKKILEASIETCEKAKELSKTVNWTYSS